MTQSSQKNQELHNLVASTCDGLLTMQQQQELNSLLSQRHDLVPEFMSLISIDHLLRQEGVQRYLALLGDECVTGSETVTKREVSAGGKQSIATPATTDWHRLWSILSPQVLAWSGSLAALVLISATIWSLLVPPSATILENHDALWADTINRQIGDGLGHDWLTIESGSSKLAFREGAFMTVEGPATFRILSSSSCELKQGSLSAYVPPEAIGFSVVMSDATVTDLGTAFRIDERIDGKTQLYVTEGRVRVDMAASRESLELQAGEIAEWSKSDLPRRRSTARIVPKTSGNVVFDNYHPASLGIGQYKHDDKIFVYLERPEAVLKHALRVDIMSQG